MFVLTSVNFSFELIIFMPRFCLINHLIVMDSVKKPPALHLSIGSCTSESVVLVLGVVVVVVVVGVVELVGDWGGLSGSM